jgi:triphosphoribosyl-dephospho-CoA synthase
MSPSNLCSIIQWIVNFYTTLINLLGSIFSRSFPVMCTSTKAKLISKCLQLATLLEVSIDKPGNVTFNLGFEGTRSEHFLASAVAAADWFEQAARRGIAVLKCEKPPANIAVGSLIQKCVRSIMSWQHGGNTLFGTVLLLMPMAAAAGMTPVSFNTCIEPDALRRNLACVLESTTARDAVCLYEAVRLANPGGLNRVSDFDVNDPASKKRILRENVSLLHIFKISANYDSISREWATNFNVTFTEAYPLMAKQLSEKKPLNVAVVNTYLHILSNHPDTLIARKVGAEKALEVSKLATHVLQLGSIETSEGAVAAREFDVYLRQHGNALNPGTTADLTAAALAVCILGGFRP